MPDSLLPIFICGSTASGKTAASIELAHAIDGEIVNGDAYQVYRHLDTITAAPSADELAQAPHHLFGVLEPTQNFDAQQYIDLAKPVITDIRNRGKTPIVVGGSGMYLKFLTHGPSPLPAGDDRLREELEIESDAELVSQLQQLDPVGAAETNLQNRRYVIRALEICILSGEPMSQLKTDWKNASEEVEKSLHGRGFVLEWDREELRQRIALRTKLMIEGGAIDEVAAQTELSATCQKAIGVRDIQAFLRDEIDKERCEELIFFATCQYAKRQRTWFHREAWLQPIGVTGESSAEEILRAMI